MAICERCGKEHDGSYGSGRFCCKSCATRNSDEFYKKCSNDAKKNYIPKLETRICPKCGKEFTVDVRKENKRKPKRFCSRSCANGHKHSESTKQKISKGIKRFLFNGGSFYLNKIKTCNSKIEDVYKSGISKHGIYKGIYCDSTYELVFVIYCLDHNISITRCRIGFDCFYNNKNHKYYPDFQCGHKNIIEIKGIHNNLVDIKASVVSKKYNYVILYEKDLKKYFDYATKRYNVNRKTIHSLYDSGYIPKLYTYACSVCGKIYTTFNKSTRQYHTCSKKCAGMVKHIKQNNKISADYVLEKYKNNPRYSNW